METHPDVRHWSVNPDGLALDTFGRLDRIVSCNPETFIDNFAQLPPCDDAVYRDYWSSPVPHVPVCPCKWCQLGAMECILLRCKGCNLALSNGLTIRYAQLLDVNFLSGVTCNRGVSGIDGSTSTAIGYAAASETPTVLFTGDMSFQYDMGALACRFIPDDFKIVVFNNGGGGIFRYIKTSRELDELEEYLAGPVNAPVSALGRAFGFRCFSAGDFAELDSVLDDFMSSPRALLEVKTDSKDDIYTLNEYYKRLRI